MTALTLFVLASFAHAAPTAVPSKSAWLRSHRKAVAARCDQLKAELQKEMKAGPSPELEKKSRDYDTCLAKLQGGPPPAAPEAPAGKSDPGTLVVESCAVEGSSKIEGYRTVDVRVKLRNSSAATMVPAGVPVLIVGSYFDCGDSTCKKPLVWGRSPQPLKTAIAPEGTSAESLSTIDLTSTPANKKNRPDCRLRAFAGPLAAVPPLSPASAATCETLLARLKAGTIQACDAK